MHGSSPQKPDRPDTVASLPEPHGTSWGGVLAFAGRRRIPRGDVHRRGGAALIGKHGRKIFPLVRRRPATPLRDSPFRGEAREDRSGPSGRKGEQHHRRGAPPPSVTER